MAGSSRSPPIADSHTADPKLCTGCSPFFGYVSSLHLPLHGVSLHLTTYDDDFPLLSFDSLCSGTAGERSHAVLLRHSGRNVSFLTLCLVACILARCGLCNIPLRRYALTTAFNDSGSRRAAGLGGESNTGETMAIFRFCLCGMGV
jgi:hypothetical protein